MCWNRAGPLPRTPTEILDGGSTRNEGCDCHRARPHHRRFCGWAFPTLGYFSQIQLSFFKSGSTCQTHQDVLPHGDLNCTYTTPILRMEKTKHAELCEQTPNSSTGHEVAPQKAGNGVWRWLEHELVAGPDQLRVRCLLAWSWALEPLW